jgi:hypothetical protein
MAPVFAIQKGAGHAASRRTTPHGDVYVHLCGSSATEGHSHEDKGALLLEAFGEAFLVDRGTPIYSDPSTSLLKEARMHNVIVPLESDGLFGHQINPCPQAICPVGQGDEKVLTLRADCSPAWGKPVRRVVRTLESPDPYHFTVTDEVDLDERRSLVFNLHSYFPLDVTGSTAVFCGLKSRLQVTWEWEGTVLMAGEDLHDGQHVPVHHLALQSPAAKTHRLVTHLTLLANES